MKKVLIAMLALLVQQLHAQNFTGKSFFVLTGKVENASIKFFELTTTGFWNNMVSRVSLNDDGSFYLNKTFEGKQQTVYCYLDNAVVTFTVRNGDTLRLSWDAADFKSSFTAKSGQLLSNKIISIQHQQYLNFQKSFSGLQQKCFESTDCRKDSGWLSLVNILFKKELAFLIEEADDNEAVFRSLYIDLYFKYAKLLSGAPHGFTTALKPGLEKIVRDVQVETANVEAFLTSYNYRIFLLKHVQLPGIDFLDDPGRREEVAPVSKLLVKSVMSNPLIHDWYIVSYIKFRQNPFNQKGAGDIYKKVAPLLSSPLMLEKLDDHLMSFVGIKPGSQAPFFTLKDSAGLEQSLSNFKGKVIYIDFWSLSCAPCISDIVNYGPQLHEQYKDRDVVFISVCVDDTLVEWQSALKKYKMINQVNLIAEGGLNHYIAQQYSATSFPTYVLIGKDGRVFNNQAQMMNELLKEPQNMVDRALMINDEY